MGLQGRPNKIFYKLLFYIFYIYFAGPGFNGLFIEGFKLFTLAYISGHGNNFIPVVFFQPRDNY